MPNIYSSCDIRHSGFKVSVVDTNLFPAGFNNLCRSFSRQTSEAFSKYLDALETPSKKVMIYPEGHTRNKFYLLNLAHLMDLIRNTGRHVGIAHEGEFIGEGLSLNLESGPLYFHKLIRRGDSVFYGEDKPDLILLNNDLSLGLPDILNNLSQPVIPSLKMGWYNRRKNTHFQILDSLLGDFATTFNFDPWLVSPLTDYADDIDLGNPDRVITLSNKIDGMLEKIAAKYKAYGINETPYVYIKNNAGTYGMGMLPLFSGEELLSLSRRRKNKLLSSRGKNEVKSFLLMEGIPTTDFYSGYPIEPVIYVVGGQDVGGFFRIHESKNELESLNAPGMTFSCLCLHKLDEPHEEYFLECHKKKDVVILSRLLAKVASLATAIERESYGG